MFAAIAAAAAVLTYFRWPSTPPIVLELYALPHVGRVQFDGLPDAPLTVIHIRDWHLVPEEDAKLDKLDYAEFMSQVEAVQSDQMQIVRHLVKHHGITAVFSEGLSKHSMNGLTLRVDVLQGTKRLADAGKLTADEKRMQREMTLTIGTPGRLLMSKEIAEVLPLEDEEAHQAANPVKDGVIKRDEVTIAARQRAMVANLPRNGIVVIILGGDHDLAAMLPEAMYVRVTPQSYP